MAKHMEEKLAISVSDCPSHGSSSQGNWSSCCAVCNASEVVPSPAHRLGFGVNIESPFPHSALVHAFTARPIAILTGLITLNYRGTARGDVH